MKFLPTKLIQLMDVAYTMHEIESVETQRKTQMHDYCDGVDDRIYKALLSKPGQNIREVWLSLITSFPLCPKISTQLRQQNG